MMLAHHLQWPICYAAPGTTQLNGYNLNMAAVAMQCFTLLLVTCEGYSEEAHPCVH